MKKDKLHWSFGDGPFLTGKVFPNGFSAGNTTLPESDFNPLDDWEQTYDVIYPGHRRSPLVKDEHIFYGSLRISTCFEEDRLYLHVQGVRQLGEDFSSERQDPDEQVNLAYLDKGKKLLPALRKAMDEFESQHIKTRKANVRGVNSMKEMVTRMRNAHLYQFI